MTEIDGITCHDGLLWRNGNYLPLFEADHTARQYGRMHNDKLYPFVYAEDMIDAMQNGITIHRIQK